MRGLSRDLTVTGAADLAVAFCQHLVRLRESHRVCGKSASISVAIQVDADLAMVRGLRNLWFCGGRVWGTPSTGIVGSSRPFYRASRPVTKDQLWNPIAAILGGLQWFVF